MLKLDWGDSQAWMTVAVELHNNQHSRLGQLPRRYPKENELNVACVCAGYAFEFILKVLVKLGGKDPILTHKPSEAYKNIPQKYCVEVKRNRPRPRLGRCRFLPGISGRGPVSQR